MSAASSGSGVCSSSMNCPNSDSSSSPTGFSSETGVCDVRRIDSTSSTAHVEVERDLLVRGLAATLGAQLALGAHDLVQLLDDVDGHADRPRLVGERTGDRLADPPRRVRRELVALAPVELLGGAHEPDRPLLDQIEERQPLVPVALRDRDDEAEVRLDHLLLRAVVAALDALRELDLLRGGQQVDLADVLEEQLQRVRRELRLRRLLDLLDLRRVEVGRRVYGVERRLLLVVLSLDDFSLDDFQLDFDVFVESRPVRRPLPCSLAPLVSRSYSLSDAELSQENRTDAIGRVGSSLRCC